MQHALPGSHLGKVTAKLGEVLLSQLNPNRVHFPRNNFFLVVDVVPGYRSDGQEYALVHLGAVADHMLVEHQGSNGPFPTGELLMVYSSLPALISSIPAGEPFWAMTT